MITEDYAIDIDRSPDAVFAVLTDTARLTEWVDGITRIEHVKQTPGHVGSIDRIVAKNTSFESEVTRWEPGRALSLRSFMKGLPGEFHYTLEPRGPSTRLRMVATFTPTSFVMKLMKPIIRRMLAKHRPRQMEKLKAVIERG